jgi:RHS repeat-associated protein
MTFREMYSYSASGLMLKKRLLATGRYSGAHSVASDYLESSYTFDSEGRMTGQTYPAAHDLLGTTEVAGTSYVYGFDSMGRPNTMTGYIDGVTYNAAGQPMAITTSNPQVNAETRVYNALGQLTSLTSGALRFEYDFSATQNDGRITTQRTFSSGTQIESIGYSYDSLNRLSSATAAGQWSASYGYDGFGNLLSVTPTGSGPSAMSVTVSASTNRVSGWTYDSNGNVTAMPGFTGTYDIENRLKEATKNSTILYGYGADNRRIYESNRTVVNSGGDTINEYVTYWSGQRIGKYKVRWNSDAPNYGAPNSFVFAKVEENLYFGSKPLKVNGGVNISADRLGSIRSGKDYFPYGQENPTTTAGDKEKYATYKHDAATDLSYADQRYYATGAGRFMTSDMSDANVDLGDPTSLNAYAYVNGDPVNFDDPSGQGFFSTIAWPFKKIGQVIFGPAFLAPTLIGPPIPPAVNSAIALYATPPPPAAPAAPRVSGLESNPNQTNQFNNAFKDAWERLNNKDGKCLKLIGSNAVAKLTGATYRFGVAFDEAGLPSRDTFATATVETNTITLNGLGRFFSMIVENKREGTREFRGIDDRLSVTQNQALVLLHEVAHLTKVLGNHTQQQSDEFNLSIARDCFGKK